jgi:hypothetical protein
MTPLTLVAIAFVLALLLFGVAFWTPIYAIPLVLVFLVGFAAAQRARRHRSSGAWGRQRRHAEHAGQGHQDDFTDRDHETLYDRR